MVYLQTRPLTIPMSLSLAKTWKIENWNWEIKHLKCQSVQSVYNSTAGSKLQTLNISPARSKLQYTHYHIYAMQLTLNGHLYKADTSSRWTPWWWSLPFFIHFTVIKLTVRRTPLSGWQTVRAGPVGVCFRESWLNFYEFGGILKQICNLIISLFLVICLLLMWWFWYGEIRVWLALDIYHSKTTFIKLHRALWRHLTKIKWWNSG